MQKQPLSGNPILVISLVVAGAVVVLCFTVMHNVQITATTAQPNVFWNIWYLFYKYTAIDTYLPEAVDSVFPNQTRFRWILSHALPPILLGLYSAKITSNIIKLLFRKPSGELLEDPEFAIAHSGVSTPPINHMPAILACLPPRDISGFLHDINIGVISIVTPASTEVDIGDRPSDILPPKNEE